MRSRDAASVAGAPWRAAVAFAAAALGGVLYFLGYVGYGGWPLLAVFLVPLWCALDDARNAGRRLAPPLLGLVFGATAYAGGFGWLWRLVEVFLAGNFVLGVVMWLAYGLWFALAFVVYAWLYARLRARGAGVAVAGIAPLVVVEWLQPQIFTVNAGAGLVHAPLLAQIADLGGPLLLTVLVAALNVVAFATWRWLRGRSRMPRAAWAVGALLVAATLGYGAWRTAAVHAASNAAPALRVGVVQANLGLLEKRTQAVVGHERHLAQSRELRGIRRPLPVSGQLIVKDLEVPLLFGGTVGSPGTELEFAL